MLIFIGTKKSKKTWQKPLTSVLGNSIMMIRQENLAIPLEVYIMNRYEILAKSREENKNRDVYEQEVLKQASRSAVVVQMVLAAIFFVTQVFAGGGINYGLWALVFSANMTISWVKYVKLRRKHELAIAIAYTVLVSVMSGYYIYNMIVSSAVL